MTKKNIIIGSLIVVFLIIIGFFVSKSKKRVSGLSKKTKGYRVSYTQILHDGKEKREVTKIVYPTKSAAQKYAKQLNRGYGSFKLARVRKA